MTTSQGTATVPLIAMMSQVEHDLQSYVSCDLTVKGGDIVSSFDNVVRMEHRLPIDSLPGTVQNLYWDARQRPDILHKFADLRDKLRELCEA